MKKRTVTIKLRVFTSDMMAFYSADPVCGTKEKPYPADAFFQLISSTALFYGPLKNILLFENDTVYRWIVESDKGEPLRFSKSVDAPEMLMEMITDKPSDEKWKKVFKDAPQMDKSGKIKLKSKKAGSNSFELETSGDVKGGGKIKYSFIFEFENEKGELKYGQIDPHGESFPPPIEDPKP